jgi:hypothetical protein
MPNKPKESALDAWRRFKDVSQNPKHWPKPRKDPHRPSVAETVAEIRDHKEKKTSERK